MNAEAMAKYDSNIVINELPYNTNDNYVKGYCLGKVTLPQSITVGGVTYKKGETMHKIVFIDSEYGCTVSDLLNSKGSFHVYMTHDFLKNHLINTPKLIVNLKLDSIGRIIEDKEALNKEKKLSEIENKILSYMKITLKNGGYIRINETNWSEGDGIEENCDYVFDNKLAALAKELLKYAEFDFIEDLCDLFVDMLNSVIASTDINESKLFVMTTEINTIDMKQNYSAAGSIEGFVKCLIEEVRNNSLIFMAYESTADIYDMHSKFFRPAYIDLISKIGSLSRSDKLSNEFMEEVCGLWYTLRQAGISWDYSYAPISFINLNDSASSLIEKVWLNRKSHFDMLDKDIKVIKELYNSKSIDNSEIIGLDGYVKPKNYVKEAVEKASKQTHGEYVADENETAAIITTISALHNKDVNSVKVIHQNGFWEVYEVIPLGISVTFNSNDTARKNAVIKTSKH